jgi:hypothetical protein
MKRIKHPDKEIEGAISYAEENGWIYKDSENPLMPGGGCFVHCTVERDIRCQFGQLREALSIMHNKFVGSLINVSTAQRRKVYKRKKNI